MRICHIVSGDLWAGAEVMAYHLLAGLASNSELDLCVVVLNEGRLAHELRERGVCVHVVEERRATIGRIAVRIAALLRHDPPHLIHAHRYKENVLAFVVSRWFSGVRLVSTQHGLPEGAPGALRRDDFKRRLNELVLKRFFRTVAVSRDIRSHLIEHRGFSPGAVSVIHNGVVVPPLCARQRRKGAFVIGSSGRLVAVKDYPLMVRVAREMADQGVDVRFMLAGEGPERSGLERLIAARGLQDRFELCGHLDAMERFYGTIDLYLNTSRHEGIPMTILEAMAHGLPVVAPRVGGIGEIVEDGREGFLVDGRDPAAFARRCLDLQGDEALWKRMSPAAHHRARSQFSVQRMTVEYGRLYREVLERRKGETDGRDEAASVAGRGVR